MGRLALRLAFLALVALVLLGLVEIALRVCYPSLGRLTGEHVYESDAELGFRPRPGASGVFFNGVPFTLNSLGLRGREIGERRPGTPRVFCLGDSFTAGKGVRDGESFPDVLERELCRRLVDRPVEVVNGGVIAYGTDQQAGLLRRLGPALRPDVVVVAFFVGNDFGDNLASGELGVYGGYLVRSKSLAGSDTILGRLRLFAKLTVGEMYLVNAMKSLSPAYRPIETGSPYCRLLVEREANSLFCFRREGEPHGLPEAAIERTRRLLVEIARDSRVLGASPVLLVLPDRLQVEAELLAAVLEQANASRESLDLSRPQTVLEGMAAALGMPCLDARGAFREGPSGRYFLECDTHFNAAGHEAVGVFLAEGILRSGALP